MSSAPRNSGRQDIEAYGNSYEKNRRGKLRFDDDDEDQLTRETLLVSALWTGLWYIFSITISVYNKWMFSADHLNFKFPLFTTCGHQLVQGILALVTIVYFSETLGTPNRIGYIFHDEDYMETVGPCALASAGDIGMGNLAIRKVTLSFFTMVKSSSLVFVLLFGILFGLERPSANLIAVVLFMTFGVLLMVAGETEFENLGFILVLMSAAFSGLRWSLTRLLLKPNASRLDEKRVLTGAKDPSLHKHNPLETIMMLSPLMAAFLFCIAVILEGLGPFMSAELWKIKGILGGCLLIAFPGALAFCMTLAEFLLLSNTSVLTLSIAGIFKEIVTISIGLIFFEDSLSLVNTIGLGITLITMVLYNIVKYQERHINDSRF